jgi:tight adherence protein C
MLITLIAVFISVGIVVGYGTSMLLSASSAERKRLRAVTRGAAVTPVAEVLPLTPSAKDASWQRALGLLGKSSKESERLQQRMHRAGFDNPAAPMIFTVLEYAGPLLAIVLALLLLKGPLALVTAAVGAMVMYFGPNMFIDQRLAVRRRDIQNGLADALDLLVVCIEAGLGLDQAIVKVSDELGVAYPILADELRTLTAEIRAGKPRIEAFKSLAQRTKVDDVRALVAMLVQTDRFGTSIGQALRTHADVSRDKRRQRAEEKAEKIGVKLVFPLVLCFFPAFYVVVLGPAIIQFVRAFMSR